MIKKFLIHLEESLNKFLGAIVDSTSRLVHSITPENTRAFLQKSTQKVKNGRVALKSKVKSSPDALKVASRKLVENLKVFLKNFIATLEKIELYVKNIEPSKEVARLFKSLWQLIYARLLWLKNWYENLSTQNFVLIVLGLIITSFIGMGVYISTEKIIKEEILSQAEAPVQLEDRPEYYKEDLRRVTFEDIKMPVYVQSAASIRSLTMDFTLQSSNRYIKLYFEKNGAMVESQFNTTIEPIIPSLPLTDEGKTILKDKIILEGNNLLKKLQIEGLIEKVFIHNISAS